jgi:hypothetical protein
MSPLLLLLAGCEPFDMLESQLAPISEAPVKAWIERELFADCDRDGDGAVRNDSECLSLSDIIDCNDEDSGIYPGAPEFCDGQDGDCDGNIDGPDPIDGATWFWDGDSDGWGAPGTAFRSCRDVLLAAAYTDGDCDDTDSSVNPGASEVCGDGIDQDCDGVDNDLLEDGLACPWVTMEGPSGTFSGASIGSAGDLNCDGATDLAVGSPDEGPQGQTRIYAGPFLPGDTPTAHALVLDASQHGLGGGFTAVGDLDNDGCDDLAMGHDEHWASGDVAVWLVTSSTSATDQFIATGTLIEADIGQSVLGTGGDVDGDDRADLVVLSYTREVAWLVTDLSGDGGALSHAATTIVPDENLGALGRVVVLGDLNGDGLAEVVFGDAQANDGAGRILVIDATSGTQVATLDEIALSGQPGAGLGAALAFAGDLNQDGFGDLVVGAPEESAAAGARDGALRILWGSTLGTVTGATLYGSDGERLGFAVIAPGNLTPERDDRPDLIVAGGTDGTLYWFPQTDMGGMTLPDQLGPDGLGGAGVRLAAAGDLDQDGLGDILVGMPTEDRSLLLVAAQFDP